jgi:hypothetical protein
LQNDVSSKNARSKKHAVHRTVNTSDKGTEKYRKRSHRFGNSHHQPSKRSHFNPPVCTLVNLKRISRRIGLLVEPAGLPFLVTAPADRLEKVA